jgi:lipoic acid synthetase
MAFREEEKRPSWVRTRVVSPTNSAIVRRSLSSMGLNTVCDLARCPNIGECWGKGHATFMILGDRCTRRCGFCAVVSGRPSGEVDEGEPERLAEAVRLLGLRHVVITSVTRDDLEDGGASVFAAAVRTIRWINPGTSVELLIPDMNGKWDSLKTVASSAPEVLGHNLETVRSMQWIRDGRASYERSLDVLSMVKDLDHHILSKSSIMLGLGEGREEVLQAMKDLLSVKVDLLTLGQYLPPQGSSLPLDRYIAPSEFADLRSAALALGFKGVMAGPMVRSSYGALDLMREAGAGIC